MSTSPELEQVAGLDAARIHRLRDRGILTVQSLVELAERYPESLRRVVELDEAVFIEMYESAAGLLPQEAPEEIPIEIPPPGLLPPEQRPDDVRRLEDNHSPGGPRSRNGFGEGGQS